VTPTALAIVTIPGLAQIRPAAFVFVAGDAVTWVEPSYLDPEPGPRPALHTIDADLVTIVPLGTPGADDPDGSCTAALLDFTDRLVELGRTIEDERAAVLASLRESEQVDDAAR
jgi:hypothetical protein